VKRKKDIITCNSAQLDRYLDREIEPEDQALVTAHLKHCPRCQEIVRQSRSIAHLLRAGVQEELAQVDLRAVETRVLAHIDPSAVPFRSRLLRIFLSRRFFVPVSALGAGLALLIMVMTFSTSVSVAPSAIVSSLKSDADAVMIFETPGSRQTVIWFHESNGPAPDNSAPGPEDSVGADLRRYPNVA